MFLSFNFTACFVFSQLWKPVPLKCTWKKYHWDLYLKSVIAWNAHFFFALCPQNTVHKVLHNRFGHTLFAKQDSKPRSGPAVLQLAEKPFSETSKNCKKCKTCNEKKRTQKAWVQNVDFFAWRASAGRRRTSPFSETRSRSREAEKSNEDPTNFWRFNERSRHIISKSLGFSFNSSSLDSGVLFRFDESHTEFPAAESLAKGGGCGRVIWRRHDEWAPKLRCIRALCIPILTLSYQILFTLTCFPCFFWTFSAFSWKKRNVKKRVWRALSNNTSWRTAVSLFFHAWSRSKSSTSHDAHANVREQSLQSLRLPVPSSAQVNAQSS